MLSCALATMGFVVGWLLILAWHAWAGGTPALLANGLAYAVLAGYATALAGRCAPKWHPALKRVATLIACAILTGVDVGISGLQGEAAQKAFFAALLGIALVVMAARHLPAGLRQGVRGKDRA